MSALEVGGFAVVVRHIGEVADVAVVAAVAEVSSAVLMAVDSVAALVLGWCWLRLWPGLRLWLLWLWVLGVLVLVVGW